MKMIFKMMIAVCFTLTGLVATTASACDDPAMCLKSITSGLELSTYSESGGYSGALGVGDIVATVTEGDGGATSAAIAGLNSDDGGWYNLDASAWQTFFTKGVAISEQSGVPVGLAIENKSLANIGIFKKMLESQ